MNTITLIEITAALMPVIMSATIRAGFRYSTRKTEVSGIKEENRKVGRLGPLTLVQKQRTENVNFETDVSKFLTSLFITAVCTAVSVFAGIFLGANLIYALVMTLTSRPDMATQTATAAVCSLVWSVNTKVFMHPVSENMLKIAHTVSEELEKMKNAKNDADQNKDGEEGEKNAV